MNVLQVANLCQARLQIPVTATFVAVVDGNASLLKASIAKALNEIADDFAWPELQKEGTFTLATGVDSYQFPGDYDRRQSETLWNRSKRWPLIGPMNAVEWQQFKSGLISTQPRQRYRVKGHGSQGWLYIDPTPTASENGQTVYYEYISRNVVLPIPWTASTAWAGNTYCSYRGYIYDRGSVGAATTGTTPPTWDGSSSDGSITWTRVDNSTSFVYDTIIADTDVFAIDPFSIIDGAVWRFKRERGLDYEDLRKDAEDQLELSKAKLQDAGVISVRPSIAGTPMIGPWSYPEEDFGI